MNLETASCITLAVVACCVTVGVICHNNNEAEVAKAAASAGLVQQVVKVSIHNPIVIWVKPPAAPLVEKEKP